jgi:hypothetical protein
MADPEPSFEALKTELRARCDAARLEHSATEPFPDEDGEPGLRILLPAGREKRGVTVRETAEAARLLAIPFEEYSFVGDYEAIAHYSKGTIEAVIRPADRFMPGAPYVARQLFGLLWEPEAEESSPDSKKMRLEVVPHIAPNGESVVLEPPSRDVRALIARASRGSGFTLRISGSPLSGQEHAIERLETLGNALLFQIDLRTGVALLLARTRRLRTRHSSLEVRERSAPSEWRYPEHTFPREPIELYWYARSARGMPLLEFLAYYQVLEYFFPTYSEQEARVRVRNVLKDPIFNPERESHLSRLFAAMRPGAQGNAGSERSQLKDTIRACVLESDLRDRLTADEGTKEFFSKKQGFVKRTLNFANPKADIRDEVADRVYEIRCMIVHTKSDADSDTPLLLPFSREAEQLVPDIDLVRFLAKRVLVAGGIPVR